MLISFHSLIKSRWFQIMKVSFKALEKFSETNFVLLRRSRLIRMKQLSEISEMNSHPKWKRFMPKLEGKLPKSRV